MLWPVNLFIIIQDLNFLGGVLLSMIPFACIVSMLGYLSRKHCLLYHVLILSF